MADDKLRALERLAREHPGDLVTRKALREARRRAGLLTKAKGHRRPRERWCPVCWNWTLILPHQKDRSRRTSGRLHARFCTHFLTDEDLTPALLARIAAQGAEREREFQCRASVVAGVRGRCPGPRKGLDPSFPPLIAVETRIRELEHDDLDHPDLPWLLHRLDVMRRRAGILPPVPPHECRQADLDYFDGQRVLVQCKICMAVFRASDGKRMSAFDARFRAGELHGS